MSFTYDPIVEAQNLSRLRVLSPLRSPAVGQALVLYPHRGEPIVVLHGEVVPDARYGTHRYKCMVDIEEHPLTLQMNLPSRHAGFSFQGLIQLACRVGDPVEVVRRGIRNVSAALHEPIKRLLREVARDYEIGEFHEAEKALNRTLGALGGDTALRLRHVFVELQMDEAEAARGTRAFWDLQRETLLTGIRRQRHLDWLRRDGREGILSEIMEREGPRSVLDWTWSAETSERAEAFSVLDSMMKQSSPEGEPFDLVSAMRLYVERLDGDPSVPFGTGRPGRLRGSLAPGGPTSSPTAEGHDQGTNSLRDLNPQGNGIDTFRRAHTPAGPPDDEPAGGGTSVFETGNGRHHASQATPPVSRLRGARLTGKEEAEHARNSDRPA